MLGMFTAAKMKNCTWLRPEAVTQFCSWNGPRTTIYAMQALSHLERTKTHEPSSRKTRQQSNGRLLRENVFTEGENAPNL